MRKDSVKLLLMAGGLALAIMYGMELASSGIAAVHGPLGAAGSSKGAGTVLHTEDDWIASDGQRSEEGTRTGSGNAADDPARNGKKVGTSQESQREGTGTDSSGPVIPRHDREPIVDRVSGKTASVLHDVSKSGIRFVVSLFEKATGS